MAWQRAIELVEEVYQVTKAFPKEEIYGLTGQLRRAAVSVPSNIAEGQSRSSREFVRYLSMAHGSLSEVETQMVIAERLEYVEKDRLAAFTERTAEAGRLIRGLSRSIQKLLTEHCPPATS